MAAWEDGLPMTVTRCAACAALIVLNACGAKLDLGGHVDAVDDPRVTARRLHPYVTITNLTFYGAGSPGMSICNGVTPPVATIMNAPYTVAPTTGTVSYGATYSWGTYTSESPGQVPPTMTLESQFRSPHHRRARVRSRRRAGRLPPGGTRLHEPELRRCSPMPVSVST